MDCARRVLLFVVQYFDGYCSVWLVCGGVGVNPNGMRRNSPRA